MDKRPDMIGGANGKRFSWKAALAAWLGGSVLAWALILAPFMTTGPEESAQTTHEDKTDCPEDDDTCLGDLAPAAGPDEMSR